MVTLEEKDAYLLMRTVADIVGVDKRASCSDATFRKHFLMIAKNPYLEDILNKLKKQINDK